MEIYEEYHLLKLEEKNSKRKYEELLDRKAEYYYTRTKPNTSNTEIEMSAVSSTSNKMLNTMINIEELEEEINCQKNIYGIKQYRLKLKEIELRDSNELLDIIYVMRYIDRMKVKHIANKLIYSHQRIYQLIDEIKLKLQN